MLPSPIPQSESPSAGTLNGRRLAAIGCGLALLLLASAAPAGTAVWSATGAGTNWSAGGNWSGGTGTAGVPGPADNVVFGNTGNATVITAVSNVVDSTGGNFLGTISSLAYTNSANNSWQNMLIAPGLTLLVTNATGPFGSVLFAGTPPGAAGASSIFASIQGPGAALTVSNPSACISLAQAGGSSTLATLVLTNLDRFSATVSLIAIGDCFFGNSTVAAQGSLFLARTNVITTTWAGNYASPYSVTQTNAIQLGEGGSATLGGLNALYLGLTNAIRTDSLGVGGIKAGGSAGSPCLLAFAPAFTNSHPTAVITGPGGTNPVTYWGVGDTASAGSSSAQCYGKVDFSNGSINVLVNTLVLGRDRNGNATEVDNGVFTFTSGNVNANTVIIGDQASASVGCIATGTMNVNGSGAALNVSGTLELGLTTLTAAPAPSAGGLLNINGGTVAANNLTVGAASLTNSIALNSGTLVVSNALATNAAGLFSLAMTNSTLGLTVADTTVKALVQTLTTGGSGNTVSLAAVPVFASYPTQFTLIKYTSLNGAGFNFTLGSVPASAPDAYLSNNVANGSIDLHLPVNPSSPPVAPGISGLTNQTVYAGAAASLVATVTGTPVPALQWLFAGANLTNGVQANGSTVSGSTNATLNLADVQNPASAGTYSLIASNSAGAVTNSLVLTVLAVPAPPVADPAPPVIPSANFNVTNYGAVGDGVTVDTTNIQNTINAASTAGGGVVEIPAGIYLSGPLTLKSSINLQVDGGAILRMLPFGQYPVTWYTNGGTNIYFTAANFITAANLTDIEISGPGAIDGQGSPWWPWANTNNAVRPIMIAPSGCNRECFQSITLSNSPMFHIAVSGNAGNTTVSNVTVLAPSSTAATNPSHNTDACDMSGTNILVINCNISTGDDDFTCGGGTAGVLLTNNTYGNGHGVSIGSYTDNGGVSNIMVINCTFNGTENGIRIKSDNDRGGLVQNIAYLNLGMTNVDFPVQVYAYYNEVGTPINVSPGTAAAEPLAAVTGTTPIYRDILFSNITATAVSGYPVGLIWARKEMPATNIVFDRFTVTGNQNLYVYNVSGAQFIDCNISLTATSNTFALFDAQVTVSNSVPTNLLFTLDGLATNGYGNALAYDHAAGSLHDTNALADCPLTLADSTFTVSNNLALGAAGPVTFVLGTNAALLAVKGSLVWGGTNEITAGPGFTNGLYTLMSYTGTLSGTPPVLGSVPAGYYYAWVTNTAGLVKLAVTLPPPPKFSGASFVGSNGSVILGGTGGTTNGTYYVLATTNLTLPTSQWTVLATNLFDGSGNFQFTNVAGTNFPRRFYQLQLAVP